MPIAASSSATVANAPRICAVSRCGASARSTFAASGVTSGGGVAGEAARTAARTASANARECVLPRVLPRTKYVSWTQGF